MNYAFKLPPSSRLRRVYKRVRAHWARIVGARVRSLARTGLAVAAALGLVVVHGSTEDRIGGYNFSYDMTGDNRVRPIQVFDDGRDTFFQFRAGDPVPAIFVMTTNGPALAMPEQQGPYVKVASISSGFVLRMGYGVGQVRFSGVGRGSIPAAMLPPQTPAALSQAQSAVRLLAATQQINGLPADLFSQPPPAPARLDTHSYATPVRGDKVEWSSGSDTQFEVGFIFPQEVSKLPANAATRIKTLAARASKAARVEVLGRDDPSHKLGTAEGRAESVAAALVAAGVPRNLISVRTTVQVKDATRNTVEGVTVTLLERAAPLPQTASAATAPVDPVSDVIRRMRSGEISVSAAADTLERLRTGGAPQPSAMLASTMPAAAPASRIWAMRKADENIQKMLDRWAKDAGWRVVWDGGPTIPITGDAPVERPDFIQAADFVVRQAKAAGYRIRATAYSNNVLQITGE